MNDGNEGDGPRGRWSRRAGPPGAAGRTPRRAAANPSPGPVPDAGRLHQAALDHLARFASTEVGLRRVLVRRAERWARRAEAAGEPAERVAAVLDQARTDAAEVARRLVAAGAVDDAAFAGARAGRLQRAGRSRRAIAAHLASKGVPAETAAAALPDADTELFAALSYCRRRRLGPFAPAPDPDAPPDATPGPAGRQRALAALARGGFARDVAERALDMPAGDAADRLLAWRRG